ncbi:MAG: hypothetical protein Ct9H90mP16_12970 [Candidatus Poseidoniales archaeon]|nr:MAG: hypothetical protein Ct9H90mP16_12970 [Candidatus Poseidoniales archaeon]
MHDHHNAEAVIAISGASGALYAERLVRVLPIQAGTFFSSYPRRGYQPRFGVGVTAGKIGTVPGVTLEDNKIWLLVRLQVLQNDPYIICPASGKPLEKSPLVFLTT